MTISAPNVKFRLHGGSGHCPTLLCRTSSAAAAAAVTTIINGGVQAGDGRMKADSIQGTRLAAPAVVMP